MANGWFLEGEWAKAHAHAVDSTSLDARFALTYLPEAVRQCASILDVGCGSGQLRRYVHELNPRAHYVGLDFSSASLAEAQRRATDARLVRADGAALPMRDAAFDLVYQHDVLMHHPRPLQMLGEMYRVSRRAVVFNARVSPRLGEVLTLRDVNHDVLYQTLPLHGMIQALVDARPAPAQVRFRLVESLGVHPSRFAWDRRPHYRKLLGYGRQFHVHCVVTKGNGGVATAVVNETRLPLWAAALVVAGRRNVWRYVGGLGCVAR
jgi:SAM-dependent methyltransferase